MARQTAWRTLQRSRYVLDNAMLVLWASSPQNMHAFERACHVCMTAVCPEEGYGHLALSGQELAKDMPASDKGSKEQAIAMAKWIQRLLDTPDYWPGSVITYFTTAGMAIPHTPTPAA